MVDDAETVRLGELITIKHGFAFSSEHYCSDGPYVLLTPGNFREGGGYRWLEGKQKHYDGPVPAEFVLSAGDMLVAMTEQAPGLLGSTLFVPDGATYLHNQRLGLVRVKEAAALSPEFLHYFLSLPEVRRHISSEAAGTKVKHTSPDRLYSISLRLPPLPEQLKIAEILRTWDEAIEKLQAFRAAKERRLAAMVMTVGFGARQFPEFRRTDDKTDHRWFSLPANWTCLPIGKIAGEISERNASCEQAEVLSCTKHSGFVRSLDYFKKQVFSGDLGGYKRIWRGDFGFPSNHVEEGSIGLQNLADVGLVSPIYTVFRFDPKRVNADYAFALLKTGLYRHIYQVNTSASVDRRGSLRWSEFRRIPFPVPPLEEQEAIAELFRGLRQDLDGTQREIDALTQQKRGLMQKLLTGKWRVSPEGGGG